jgi:16S rRNA (guanine(966)-N(2))-methyltransferase RsmD
LATRPTLARIRESIFSRVASRINLNDLEILDLFAGTGALGIEALSRGASRATFVDNSRRAVEVIQRNVDELGFAESSRVVCGEVTRALGRLATDGESFDLVFMDPPYRSGIAASVLNEVMDRSLLRPDGIVVVELARGEPVPAINGLERESVATLGDHQIALYRRRMAPLG